MRAGAAILLLVTALAVVALPISDRPAREAHGLPASPTPEPLVPTVPASALTSASRPAQAPEPAPRAGPSSRAESFAGERWRFGVGIARSSDKDYDNLGELEAGWYLNWNVDPHPQRPAGTEFAQMVRVSEQGFRPDRQTIAAAVAANPGALWLIGNEPDVRWQDNTTPETYAGLYHQLYTFLKAQDPACRVAVAGISQPTPLRLTYLEQILAAYEQQFGSPMPVDVWNVHAFILREERNSWGVDIPPGLSAGQGMLYDVQDHDDLSILKAQIEDFRRWMRDHGQRNKPLIVSEYGILMPEYYDFSAERVQRFMTATFDYFLTATDAELGYPDDGNRLVQRWAWYSLSDTLYPTGNLVDAERGTLTPLGRTYAGYAAGRDRSSDSSLP